MPVSFLSRSLRFMANRYTVQLNCPKTWIRGALLGTR